jgi:hypothetical protein
MAEEVSKKRLEGAIVGSKHYYEIVALAATARNHW